ncbi:MAG: hypothetical protein IJS81_07255, partial [Selenomonadaceae bacterium]|nr:hypothetical protein [Selenomonadaceae bacterium]
MKKKLKSRQKINLLKNKKICHGQNKKFLNVFVEEFFYWKKFFNYSTNPMNPKPLLCPPKVVFCSPTCP